MKARLLKSHGSGPLLTVEGTHITIEPAAAETTRTPKKACTVQARENSGGYGFSNDAKGMIGVPSFSAASFPYDGQNLDLTMSLHY